MAQNLRLVFGKEGKKNSSVMIMGVKHICKNEIKNLILHHIAQNKNELIRIIKLRIDTG